jgi:hypothetical protein
MLHYEKMARPAGLGNVRRAGPRRPGRTARCARGLSKADGHEHRAKNYHEPKYNADLSRLDVAILGFHPGWAGRPRRRRDRRRTVRQITARNPSILLGQYTILNESSDDVVRTAASRDRIDKLNDEGLVGCAAPMAPRPRGRASTRPSTSTSPEWSRPDRNGDRYPQWLARRDFSASSSRCRNSASGTSTT